MSILFNVCIENYEVAEVAQFKFIYYNVLFLTCGVVRHITFWYMLITHFNMSVQSANLSVTSKHRFIACVSGQTV